MLFPCINRAEIRVDCSENRKEVFMKTLKLAVMIFLSFALCVGCAGVGNYATESSPPNGLTYQNHDGVMLKFVNKIGVYEVVELPGTYFHDGLYYRVGSTGQCVLAEHFNGPWRLDEENAAPAKLATVNGNNKYWN